jgi:ferric-dicitrate binding protein FerR (iron transport regulator)
MNRYFRKILSLFTETNYQENVKESFYRWLTADEKKEEKEQALRELWDELCLHPDTEDVSHAYRRWRQRQMRRSSRAVFSTKQWLRIAVALLVAVSGTAVYLAVSRQTTEIDIIQQYIPVAEMRQLTLPDGTEVQLNSTSTLLYPTRFTGKQRSVFLIGEANFKVKPDSRHPFVVKANDFQVTALGTEFNVSSYPDAEESSATLISGSVLMEYNKLQQQLILSPNEQFVYRRHARKYRVERPDMADVTAWQRGELVFREVPIANILSVLERKYPYTFIYNEHKLSLSDHYTFRFDKSATLEEVMKVIVQVTGGKLTFYIEGDRCYVRRK